MYALFNKVLTLPKTLRVANVDKHELGDLGISIRECMRVSLIGNTFGHPKFANFFSNQAEITTESSMAKRGWFAELFVTAKRFNARGDSSTLPQVVAQPTAEQATGKVSSFFGSKKK